MEKLTEVERGFGEQTRVGGKRPVIAWAITGAGHFLSESVGVIGHISGLATVDVFLSRAAAEVVGMYKVAGRLDEFASSVVIETDYSFPITSKFSVGKYDALVISPATGNTVAKCVHGVADSLVSCMFAQAGKSRVPIVVLPTDVSGETASAAPNGNTVMVYPRPLDLELTRKLGAIDGVTALSSPDELCSCVERMLEKR
ncbi:MAG: flavoprotein [Synergistaceae bacterium]|jgi:flavoprotein|nr:flavoprotein [Synergistaceae bacterium]